MNTGDGVEPLRFADYKSAALCIGISNPDERSHSSSAERQIPMNRGMSDVGVYYLT